MCQNTVVIISVSLLLCLSFNYTFPFHRGSTYSNKPLSCKRNDQYRDDLSDPLKQTTRPALVNNQKPLSAQDIIRYEQLVIKKKYPYLDLKDMEIKFNPFGKKVRNSVKFNSGTNFEGDSGICESSDDGLNVEVVNRGLTGFAIPAKIMKDTKMFETKLYLNNVIQNQQN